MRGKNELPNSKQSLLAGTARGLEPGAGMARNHQFW